MVVAFGGVDIIDLAVAVVIVIIVEIVQLIDGVATVMVGPAADMFQCGHGISKMTLKTMPICIPVKLRFCCSAAVVVVVVVDIFFMAVGFVVVYVAVVDPSAVVFFPPWPWTV